MNFDSAERLLKEHNQTDLLLYYPELDARQRRVLLDDISRIDFSVFSNLNGGEANALKGLEPISAISLSETAARRAEFTLAGISSIKRGEAAAVLLAGGQGTRLGFDKAKGMFDIGVTRPVSLFGLLFKSALASATAAGRYFPLFVMTSTENDAQIRAYLKSEGCFGYPEDRVFFFAQGNAPTCGFDGKIFLSEKYRVSFSPDGNGGWYPSLVNSGLGKILESEGIKYINVFGVDNALQKVCDPAFIGAFVLSGQGCASKVVRKDCAEENVGVLCMRGGKTAVVEYYEMPPALKYAADEKGLLFGYGVTLNYLFSVRGLKRAYVNKLPYHAAKKAIPHIEGGVKVTPKSPCGYKMETLIVDAVEIFGDCLAYEVERDSEFAPVKNRFGRDSAETAREKLVKLGYKL